MIKVYFMRNDITGHKKRGDVAALPTNKPCFFVVPFIIVQIDEATIPEDYLGDSTVRLDLEKLMAMDEYQDYPEEYTDDNGDKQTCIVRGYFHPEGRSNAENPPVITMSDVIRGEVSNG